MISAEIGKLRDGQKCPHFGSLSRVARPLAQQNLGHASLARTTVYGSTEAKRRMKAVSAFWAGKR